VRIHHPLFKSEKPDDAEGGYLNDLNPESEVIYPKAMIESGFDEVKARAPWPEAAGESELGRGGLESVRFQGMRVAYFVSVMPLTTRHPSFYVDLFVIGYGSRR
jgi:glutaminyl-tRNA synthetase